LDYILGILLDVEGNTIFLPRKKDQAYLVSFRILRCLLIVYSCRIGENETLPNIAIYYKQHKEIKNTTVYIWKEKLNMYCVSSISSATHQTDVILKLKCE
jgi:hypothetical protein